MEVAIGIIIGFVIVGPVACWLIGAFNPMGYLGVPPWRVPPCTCGGRDFSHDSACPRSGP